MKCSGHSELK